MSDDAQLGALVRRVERYVRDGTSLSYWDDHRGNWHLMHWSQGAMRWVCTHGKCPEALLLALFGEAEEGAQ